MRESSFALFTGDVPQCTLKMEALEPGFQGRLLAGRWFHQGCFLRAPPEWELPTSRRLWKLDAPGRGLGDAPHAFRRSRQKHIVNSDLSPVRAGWHYRLLSLDPRLFSVFREVGGAAGAPATHIDDISGCGGTGVLEATQGVWVA